jgi:predicted ATPase
LLADVAAIADALHRVSPKLRLVITSQAPLRLACERVLRLDSLAVPDRPLPAQEALAFGAVALFVERAQAADARFVLTNAAAPAVIELCRALDGMALAIELAAVRAPTLGVQRLASTMHERLRVLTSSRNRSAPVRQQTLRAALEWSHALLDEREQAVFRRLAVVAGSASLELIQRIAVCERWNEWDVLDALDLLVERSLVAVVSGAEGQAPRYRLLESPRAYARERLEAAAELHTVQRAHALAVRDLLTARRDERETGLMPYQAGLDVARPDNDNARDAFAWARAAGQAELAVQIGGLLLQLLPQEAVAPSVVLSDAVELLLAGELPAALQARVWWDISKALGDTHQRRSFVAAQRAVEILSEPSAASASPPWMLYRALGRVAEAAANLRDETTARRAMAAALELERPEWPLAALRGGAQAQVFVEMMFGEPAETVRLAQRSIALERRVGASGNSMMNTLIDAYVAAGDTAAAVAAGRELVAHFEGSRNEMDLAYVRLNLAAAHLVSDDTTAARPLLESGWSQTAAFDFMRPYFADYLALLAALDGWLEAAVRLCGYADAAYIALEDTRQPNEAGAVERARALARAALGDAAFERLQGEGGRCGSDEVAALAFGAAR